MKDNFSEEIKTSIEKEKIIVIIRNVKQEDIIPIAEAMYAGGIRLIEIAYDAKGIISDDITQNMIHSLVNRFNGEMFVGAGTVLNKSQVLKTKEAGGGFVISPDTNPEVIQYTKMQGLISIPGALTPTEIQNAYSAGADYVKLFPASAFGSDYIKAIKAPLSHVKLLVVGGVNEDNINEYINQGAIGVGVGSNILNHKMIAERNYDGLMRLAQKYYFKVHNVKAND